MISAIVPGTCIVYYKANGLHYNWRINLYSMIEKRSQKPIVDGGRADGHRYNMLIYIDSDWCFMRPKKERNERTPQKVNRGFIVLSYRQACKS